jgi:hypothetical protein
VKYYYDTEGKMIKKVITPASGSAQTIYYEMNDDNTVVEFSAGGGTVTSHSKTDVSEERPSMSSRSAEDLFPVSSAICPVQLPMSTKSSI